MSYNSQSDHNCNMTKPDRNNTGKQFLNQKSTKIYYRYQTCGLFLHLAMKFTLVYMCTVSASLVLDGKFERPAGFKSHMWDFFDQSWGKAVLGCFAALADIALLSEVTFGVCFLRAQGLQGNCH